MDHKKTGETLREKLRAFIPRHISNGFFIGCYELLRMFGRRHRENRNRFFENTAALSNHRKRMQDAGGFIEDQNAWTDLHYGKATMQFSGCEIFAVYNTLLSLCRRELRTLPELISYFERDGITLSGNAGTAPKALRDFFGRGGFPVEMTTKEAEFQELSEKSDALILTMYNNRDNIMHEVHTVSITKAPSGFLAHNVYGNGQVVGPARNINDLISSMNGGKAKGISLIGVRRLSK